MTQRYRQWSVRLPTAVSGPLRTMANRLFLALSVMSVMCLFVVLGRDGYRDNADGHVSLLDAMYYTTVSLSTTGYGDIVPTSNAARLTNILAVTPLRFLFLVILVGTTFEVLAERTRTQWRVDRWRSKLRKHTVIVGYGTKGRSAVATLLAAGYPKDQIVIVDRTSADVAEAVSDGLATVTGDAAHSSVLRLARAELAERIVIAVDRDDTAVLVTLTARQLSPDAVIVAAVREAENGPLVRQSGATTVITSSEAAGRLLGVATVSPAVNDVFEDLLIHGSGLDLAERPVRPDEIGRGTHAEEDMVLAVIRAGTRMRFDEVDRLAAGDRLVVVRSRRER